MSTTITEEFSADNIPQSNWFKFESVGDNIKGTLSSIFIKTGDEDFADQKVYVLVNCTINGKEVPDAYNVGIKATSDYIVSRMNKAKIGQRVGFKFEKEIEPKKKGYKPAKSINPFVWGMDETFKPTESFDNTQEITPEDCPF